MTALMMKLHYPFCKYVYGLAGAILLLLFCIGHINSPPVYFTAFMSEKSNNVVSEDSSKFSCDGRRIYMYDLPPQFNSALVENCSGKIVPWLNFCRHAENNGLGRKVGNKSGWYETDLYMVEVVFHARMKEYPCLASKAEEADVFFIPYYSGLDALRFLYGEEKEHPGEHGIALVSWLEKNAGSTWRRRGGTDHFMVTGRTAWDLNRPLSTPPSWGTSLLLLPALENVTLMCVERNTWMPREQAIPYLTSFHPNSTATLLHWTEAVRSAPRKFLFAFSGGERKGVGLRQVVIQQCKNSSSSCSLLDCHVIKCTHNPEPIMRQLMEAEFCLQPPGDSPTRRATFDALIAGCIPVFFRNDSAYLQYTWHLPSDAEAYSVFVPEEGVVEGRVRIADVLSGYSVERKKRMRENIVGIIPRLVYMGFGGCGGVKDAFDVTVEGMLRKARGLRDQL